MRQKKIIIAYIAGLGHSGSTLTDLLLGSQQGVESFGELSMLDKVYRGILADGRCTCGERLQACSLWGSVLDSLEGRGLDIAAMKLGHKGYKEITDATFTELAARTREGVIVDSSKSTQRLRSILDLPRDRFDLRIIHLVRDGRAVAFSNTRKGRSFRVWMKRWKKENLEVEALARLSENYIRIRYEDLVADPRGTVGNLLAFLDVEPIADITLDWTERESHNIGGNRMRRSSEAGITRDDEYVSGVSDRQWRQAGEIAGALLRSYGYEDLPDARRTAGAFPRMRGPSILKRIRRSLGAQER